MLEQGPRLSALELVVNKTMDLRLAALLWLVMEHKGSIIVAAGPQRAGKTTLLMASLDFLPPEVQQVTTRGMRENFGFLQDTDPKRTMILCAEISDHVPQYYMWGTRVARMFHAISQGYSLGATMHADTPQEVLGMLQSPPLNIPAEHLARLTLIVNLRMAYGSGRDASIVRRVYTVCVPGPSADDSKPLPATIIARWNPSTDALDHAVPPQALNSLSLQLGMETKEIEGAIAEREKRLLEMLGQRVLAAEDFRKAVLAYY